MNTLLDDLCAPGEMVHNGDWQEFYKIVERIDPFGKPILIDVEIYYNWDKDEIVDYATVSLGHNLGNGLQIEPDAIIMLTDKERRDFAKDQEVVDYIQEAIDGAADVELHNKYWDASR